MAKLIIFLSISVFFSFLCSILEAVLLSITPTFMNVKLKEGKKYAKRLNVLKSDVDKPLISILTLNTVAHTVGAIGVGAAAVTYFQGRDFYGLSIAEIIVPTLTTIIILIASEIIPKTIGATFWKQLAPFTANTLHWMVMIMKYSGILWILKFFTKFFGKKEKGSVFSRADYTTMTEIVSKQGVLQEEESRVITNLLEFNKEKVVNHMTPRGVLSAAHEDMTISDYFEREDTLPFSRIPVYKEDNVDKITGFVLKDEMLTELVNGRGDKKLSDVRRDVLFISRDMDLPSLLKKLMKKGPKGKNNHIAIVIDDFGGTEGIITMEDVMEALLGMEIVDELDAVEDMRKVAENDWEERSKDLDT